MFEISTRYDQMYQGIIEGTIDYLRKYIALESLIIGVSGGVDSALVATLASCVQRYLDREIKIYGVSLPTHTNTKEETVRARNVGKVFCDKFFESYVVMGLLDSLEEQGGLQTDTEEDKVRTGNTAARLRMTVLYDYAFCKKGMVLSTDNYTEYLLGFWTLHGDVGDFGMIQNLWKSEVYGLADFLVDGILTDTSGSNALEDCVNALPTDGLGITPTDFDQIIPDWKEIANGDHRKAYRYIDNNLYKMINGKMSVDSNVVVRRWWETRYKRQNPYNLLREFLLPDEAA